MEARVIDSFEELLRQIVDVGIRENRSAEVELRLEHPNHIGNMYEGLAKEVLRASLFADLNLRVCSGKVRGRDGDSGQLDCMVALGEGSRMPNTDDYVYDIDDVLAIIEVKKTHNRTSLGQDVDKVTALPELRPYEQTSLPEHMIRVMRDATRASLGRDKWLTLQPGREIDADMALRHSILVDASTPLRVVLGFGGFQTESGFRRALTACLRTQIDKAWTRTPGLVRLPNLVISGDFYAYKTNGLPFPPEHAALGTSHGHVLFNTASDGALRALLNLLWYRISMRFDRNPSWFTSPPRASSRMIAVIDGTDNPLQIVPYRLERTEVELRSSVGSDAPFVSLEAFVLCNALINKTEFSFDDHSEFAKTLGAACSEFLETWMQSTEYWWREEYESASGIAQWLRQSSLFELRGGKVICRPQVPACCATPFGLLACENRLGALAQFSPSPLQSYLSQVKDVAAKPTLLAFEMDNGGTESKVREIDEKYFAQTLRRMQLTKELCASQGTRLSVSLCYGGGPASIARQCDDISLMIDVRLLRELQHGARVVLRDPLSYADVGQAAACSPFRTDESETVHAANVRSVRVLAAPPQCPERDAFADEVVIWGLLFAAYHSVAHVLQAHSTVDERILEEGNATSVGTPAALALELAADSFALACFRDFATMFPRGIAALATREMNLGACLLLRRTSWADYSLVASRARALHWHCAQHRDPERALGLDAAFVEAMNAITNALPRDSPAISFSEQAEAREGAFAVWRQLRPSLEQLSKVGLMRVADVELDTER